MSDFIHIKNLGKSQTLAAGTSYVSDPVDLRDISQKGDLSLLYTVGCSGTNATCGSAVFSYQVSNAFDGSYITPLNGTFGTCAVGAGGSDLIALPSVTSGFIKIVAAIGTNGAAVVSLHLNVR